ncbi:HAMP domain-containing methyl-accepting chemotaxis protein [Sporosarcina sp. E16_8]|uniref:methyl-accepting chemotaxis protein n=1 Tax=Sporosarcina sp. E16_8 TaxID=2789295 RepID=UPI001A91D4BB|nr:HAMP domain-containing methyl-accepting chemotaxis protein [Sporosarcina sp. E16_8]MBO0587457.1 methyl-accepting chemotaxis protein [Sporosarcina sp. E16_8]
MRWSEFQMKLFGKMLLAFGGVIAVFISLNIYNLVQTKQLNENSETMYTNGMVPSTYLIKIGKDAENIRVQMVTTLAFKDTNMLDRAVTNLDNMKIWIQKYEEINMNSEEVETFDGFKNNWLLFDERANKNIQLMRDGNWMEAEQGIKEEKIIFDESIRYFNELVVMNEQLAEKIKEDNQQVYSKTLFWSLVLACASIAISVLIAYIFSQKISKRLAVVVNRVKEIEEGDLRGSSLVAVGQDEITTLSMGLNNMYQTLREVVAGAQYSGERVTASSEELSASAEESMAAAESVANLSQQSTNGAEDQLRSVNDMSTAIENMMVNMQAITVNSEQMNSQSHDAYDKTQIGSIAVNSVSQQMLSIADAVKLTSDSIHNLDGKSKEISNIVQMITGIADQTNLLALNAAIEAARAGESGKGFAVVADEVRKLAEKSRVSAEKIFSMVNEIQLEIRDVTASMQQGTERVQDGLVKTKEVGHIFEEIELMVEKVTGNATEVNRSVEVMSTISQSISSSVGNVHEVAESSVLASQENSAASEQQVATMEEISAASESLAHLAEDLQKTIQHFRL